MTTSCISDQQPKNFYPIFLFPAIFSKDTVQFSLPLPYNKKITIPIRPQALRRLIPLCDGNKNIQEILQHFRHTKTRAYMERILDTLIQVQVIHNSADMSQFFTTAHNAFITPQNKITDISHMIHDTALQKINVSSSTSTLQRFSIPHSPLTRMLTQRKSTRTFNGTSIKHASLMRMLWSAYGTIPGTVENTTVPRRVVASAGGLYPLNIHLALLQPTHELDAGIYRIVCDLSSVTCIRIDTNMQLLDECFGDPRAFWDASGLIIISGSYERTAKKYGSRSMTFVNLEAGHSIQNICLTAQYDGIGTVQLGHIKPSSLIPILNIEHSGLTPIMAIAFGNEGNAQIHDAHKYMIQHVDCMPVGPEDTPIYVATAYSFPRSGRRIQRAYGRSTNKDSAIKKATVELFEWSALNWPLAHILKGNDGVIRAYEDMNPDNVIHPTKIYQQPPNKYLKPFSETDTYWWVVAQNGMCERKYILADLVFTGNPAPRPFFPGNSSGAAAHITLEQALESATLELIERDAFMLTWLCNICAPRFRHSTLPVDIQQRIQAMEARGFEISICDITTDLAPVILVCAINRSLPLMRVSTCAGYDPVAILEHALLETESTVHRAGQNYDLPATQYKAAKYVRHLKDHGKHYTFLSNIEKASRLTQGTYIDFPMQSSIVDFNHVCTTIQQQSMELWWVNLTPYSEYPSEFSIVKTFIPGVIPLTFGHNTSPIKNRRLCAGYNKTLNKRIHPFT